MKMKLAIVLLCATVLSGCNVTLGGGHYRPIGAPVYVAPVYCPPVYRVPTYYRGGTSHYRGPLSRYPAPRTYYRRW